MASIAVAAGGCWNEDLIGGTFTDEQLAAIRAQYVLPPAPASCPEETPDDTCARLRYLGQRLFFDPSLSSTGTVACATCHDPAAWFVDSRRENAVSQGVTGWTARNAVSLVNVGLKPPGTFTWIGVETARDVVEHIAWPKAMGVNTAAIGAKVRANARYTTELTELLPATCRASDYSIGFCMLEPLDVYMRSLVSVDSPFRQFTLGNDHAMSPAALRGFGVFVGRGMCAECHGGPLLSDGRAHVTGVPQTGEHAPTTDAGRDGTGAFMTPSLLGVAQTGPYMHDGSFGSLAEVVDFYRWGGGVTGAPKDPLIEPLPIDDDDAADLAEFLQTLTGPPVPSDLRAPPP